MPLDAWPHCLSNGQFLSRSNLPSGRCGAIGTMTKMFPMGNRLKHWRLARGLNQEDVAHDAGMSTSHYNRLENGKKTLTTKHLEKFSRILEVSQSDLLSEGGVTVQTVALVGYVGAGEMYYPDPETGPWEEIERVEAPPGETDVVAVRVRGDSMEPMYKDGYILYSRGPSGVPVDSCLGEDCLVQLRNGAAYLKTLRRGSEPGKYTLKSYNQAVEPIENVEIEWAAPIEWVRRVRK